MASGKKQFIIFHITGVIIFLCLPVLFLSSGPENKNFMSIVGNGWFWMFSFLYIGIFYLNAYWLFPRLYLKKQYELYIIALILVLVVVYFVQPFDHIISLSPPPSQPPGNFNNTGHETPSHRQLDFVSLFLYAVAVALSLLVPVVQQWQKTQQQFVTAQKDKANAELTVLKAQINPHFLFNTLNNLYSLSLTNSEKTSESILHLSNIMRYITDEVQNDFVPFENEINCIADFIELQKLRMNNKTMVFFASNAADSNLHIAPLILLPFVENVFKHGISNNESNTVEIKIAVKEKDILFYTKNSIFYPTNNVSRQGTGITNVKKRLENLYAGNYFLKTENDGKFFEVHLVISTTKK
jgi:two-component system, LytTR family, sensor kinase